LTLSSELINLTQSRGNFRNKKRMKRIALSFAAIALNLLLGRMADAQTLFWRTDGTTGGIWSTSAFWSAAPSPTGGSVWVSGDNAEFSANSTLTFASTAVGNVTVDDGVTVTVTAGGTLTLGGVRTFTVGTGSTLTWTSQPTSTALANEGMGIIKNGSGILNLGAIPANANGRYDGGFTLNAGTVVVSGGSSFGTGVMTINGGVVQSAGGNTYTSSSLVIGGNFSFAGTGNDIWNQTVSLGAVDRTITNNTTGTATRTFSNTISSTGGGLIFSGTGGSGGIVLSAANSYSGGTTINGGKVIASHDGALGSGNVSLTASGVNLTLQSGATNNYIADNATISIVNGAVATLSYAFGQTDVVGGITLDGIVQTAPGTYGSSTSGANFQFAFFSGTGTLTLIPEPATSMLLGIGFLLGAQWLRRKTS
jgi:autotransporter-associated beta strand protein